MYRIIRYLAPTLLILTSTLSWSQFPERGPELRVRLSWEDENRVSLRQVRVELLTGTENYIAQAFSDDTGNVDFGAVPAGNHRLRVSGIDVVEVVTPVFSIDARENVHNEYVRIKYKPLPGTDAATAAASKVSVAALEVPDKARDEFEKGSTALQKKNFDEAKKRFTHAVEMYPKYAAAWNSLGVLAMNTGDPITGGEMFAKALQADPQYPAAYVNRAKTFFATSDFKAAEEALTKATTLEPDNAEANVLLAHAEYQNGEYAKALEHARKVHTLSHQGLGVAHMLAGQSLEALKRPAEAVNEFKLYLAETPNGANADRVRAHLAQMSPPPH